ncbi:MAG: hypothetical protein A2655_02875 [Candidatus Yanofskybacteria bacterium RIFCSPHIGHO2_01_FULL_43_42]|uniref:Uncharacterized protein n=1 Tax=Candidatus Yanofskybacteria bacterium RIFCSPLOWO2_01_FULL_43_22 TaxID=1802695 RepID=A0A1F8GF06_9BACT|nr:MAG: hypothetical protein A2655_02875 [Candidatus Yanofskybacteria bacterium RIFCSPHIGHO2_01_FULL_43_42]OGN12952.1 MAG: hypothetical protein A3D48_03535 [Candidatus Yanofskybacteria bacterium RIFCSPHIGHO2_02_FULL_43_17]OGN23967.1 MAG: hypothetical protein A3A13_02720 [Candidatus Yanofskybacteria bacterium RIFCSPLOWO2_01_FULL_43_22]
MDQKGFANMALVVLVGVAGYFALNNRSTTPAPTPSPTPTPSVNLLKVCPEEWYVNQMPGTVGLETDQNKIPNEYFIYKGIRRELSEFDINWVKTNCSVRPQVVY